MKINKNYYSYIIAIIIFFALKFSYTLAETKNLIFLLKPTNWFIETTTNLNSQYVVGSGYFFEELDIIIDKSCSGFNFLLLCYLMLLFLVFRFIQNQRIRILSIPLLFLVAYITTIFTNTSRILLSIFIEKAVINTTGASFSWLHQAEGSFVYLFSLILIYFIIDFILTKIIKNHA